MTSQAAPEGTFDPDERVSQIMNTPNYLDSRVHFYAFGQRRDLEIVAESVLASCSFAVKNALREAGGQYKLSIECSSPEGAGIVPPEDLMEQIIRGIESAPTDVRDQLVGTEFWLEALKAIPQYNMSVSPALLAKLAGINAHLHVTAYFGSEERTE
jgi:hypothetical protein